MILAALLSTIYPGKISLTHHPQGIHRAAILRVAEYLQHSVEIWTAPFLVNATATVCCKRLRLCLNDKFQPSMDIKAIARLHDNLG